MTSQSKFIRNEDPVAKELRGLGYSELVIDIVVGEMNKPEGKVRLQWLRKLVKDYHFPATQIDIEVPAGVGRDAGKHNIPVRADIVVYRDQIKTKPFSVIETKAPTEKAGIAQAESYARNLGAEYHVWSDGFYVKAYKTSNYPNQSDSITRLPIWVTDKPLPSKVPKTESLRPFKDEEELRQIISYCHDQILEKLGHDPAKAFDEMTKLLFLKVYDEREVPNFYEFAVLAEEIPHDTGDRIRALFDKAITSSKYQDVFWCQFNSKPVPVTLELDDFSIFNIVQVLQGFSLVNTTENIEGADIKGTVYEQMVGTTFRGELAQFFTPRELVDFVVEAIRPNREDKILDPACGSGGFLIMVIRKLREWIKQENPNLSDSDMKAEIKYVAEHKTFGIDINDRMVRVAKMNMIMHGDGHSGIYHILRGGGLLTDPNLPDRLKEELKDGTVNIIYSNPPFAGREKDPVILRKFKIGVNKDGKPLSVSKEALFIEKIIDLLAPNGRAGLVLPSGVFNNPNYVMKEARKLIKTRTKILAIIGLPHLAFQITGANNEGSLLFLQKVDNIPQDYPIYIDWANYIGFGTTGKKIPRNDLKTMLPKMKNPKPENLIMFSQLGDRIDPWYYHPKYKEIEETIAKSNYPLKSIADVVKKSTSQFKAKEHLDEVFEYVETSDVDLENGNIVTSQIITGKTAPNRARYVLREGDFLIPNARDCIRGIAVVDKPHEGFVCTNRFFVVRPNEAEVIPKYLYYMLRQPEILSLLKRQATGEINPGLTWSKETNALTNVKIPVPDKPTQQDIVNKITEQEDKKKQLLKEIEEMDNEILRVARDTIPLLKLEKQKLAKLGYDYIGEL